MQSNAYQALFLFPQGAFAMNSYFCYPLIIIKLVFTQTRELMNSKNLLLLFTFFVACLNLSASQYDYQRCQHVLKEIKNGAPYQSHDAATMAAATIATVAEKIANDPSADKKTKQDALLKANCANFFINAGIYYTYQKQFDAFHEQFITEQKHVPSLSKEEYMKRYFKAETTTPSMLAFRAQEREKSPIASSEEKAAGTFWKPVLQAYAKSIAAEKTEKNKPQ